MQKRGEVLSVQFAQLHWAFTTNTSELKALYSYHPFGLHGYIDTECLWRKVVCMNWSEMLCVLPCVISSVCLITVTEYIRILVRDTDYTSIPASDTEQSLRICTCVFYLLRSRRCVLEADNAGLWVLRCACGCRSTTLRQWGWGGGGEGGTDGSPSWSQCWRGRVVSAREKWLCVGSDLVVVIVFLVVHAGPGRLVLHAL